MYKINGLPPGGLSLEFSRSAVSTASSDPDVSLEDIQGTYECLVWGIKPFERVKSNSATFIFSGKIALYSFNVDNPVI